MNVITPRNVSTPEEPPYIGHFCGNFNPIQGNERQKRTCARDSENRNEERKMKTKGKTKEKRVSVGVPLPPRKNIKTSMNRKKPLYPIQGFHPRISPTAHDRIAANPRPPRCPRSPVRMGDSVGQLFRETRGNLNRRNFLNFGKEIQKRVRERPTRRGTAKLEKSKNG